MKEAMAAVEDPQAVKPFVVVPGDLDTPYAKMMLGAGLDFAVGAGRS